MTQPNKKPQKIAWITGASSGIGRALCLRMALDGWQIAATARNVDALIHLQDSAPKGSIHCYPGDVSNAARMKDIMGQVMTHLGGLDCVIMAAGILIPDNATTFNADRFRRMVDTNLCGTANVLDPALAHFVSTGQGHVVFVGSMAAYTGMRGFLSYGPTKSAVRTMAQSLHADMANTDIKVQIINPGFVATPMLNHVDTGEIRPMPVDEAVEHIMRGLKSNRFDISFPLNQSVALRTLNMLPQKWARTLLAKWRT